MKQPEWAGGWESAILSADDDPFGYPFNEGDTVLLRKREIGVAALKQGSPSALRYITPFEAEDSCGQFKKLKDTAHYDKIFNLTREELRDKAASAPEPHPIAEVKRPKEIPAILGGAKVHVASSISFLDDPIWMAEWFFDKQGQPHMVWEKVVLYAALAMGDQDFIDKTNLHEPFERRRAFKFMSADYGRVKPAEREALTRQFSGVAHGVTIRVVEGFQSEAAYNKFLRSWIKKAKLPIKPEANEF